MRHPLPPAGLLLLHGLFPSRRSIGPNPNPLSTPQPSLNSPDSPLFLPFYFPRGHRLAATEFLVDARKYRHGAIPIPVISGGPDTRAGHLLSPLARALPLTPFVESITQGNEPCIA
jgi:hypothetical protein